MTDTLQFGRHMVQYEELGIAIFTYRGDVTAEQMQQICALPDHGEHAARFVLTLFDMRELGEIPGPARKMMSRPPPAGRNGPAGGGVTVRRAPAPPAAAARRCW